MLLSKPPYGLVIALLLITPFAELIREVFDSDTCHKQINCYNLISV